MLSIVEFLLVRIIRRFLILVELPVLDRRCIVLHPHRRRGRLFVVDEIEDSRAVVVHRAIAVNTIRVVGVREVAHALVLVTLCPACRFVRRFTARESGLTERVVLVIEILCRGLALHRIVDAHVVVRLQECAELCSVEPCRRIVEPVLLTGLTVRIRERMSRSPARVILRRVVHILRAKNLRQHATLTKRHRLPDADAVRLRNHVIELLVVIRLWCRLSACCIILYLRRCRRRL